MNKLKKGHKYLVRKNTYYSYVPMIEEIYVMKVTKTSYYMQYMKSGNFCWEEINYFDKEYLVVEDFGSMKTDYSETVKALNEVLEKLIEIQNRKPITFKEYLRDAWKGFLITLKIKHN